MYAVTCTCMHFVTHGHTECMSICVHACRCMSGTMLYVLRTLSDQNNFMMCEMGGNETLLRCPELSCATMGPCSSRLKTSSTKYKTCKRSKAENKTEIHGQTRNRQTTEKGTW